MMQFKVRSHRMHRDAVPRRPSQRNVSGANEPSLPDDTTASDKLSLTNRVCGNGKTDSRYDK